MVTKTWLPATGKNTGTNSLSAEEVIAIIRELRRAALRSAKRYMPGRCMAFNKAADMLEKALSRRV